MGTHARLAVSYRNQEGRAAWDRPQTLGYRYSKEHGVDSFTAYEMLGFPVDDRDYGLPRRS